MPLLRAAKALEGMKGDNDDERTGVDSVRRAIRWPARLIVENAGLDGSVVVGKLIEHKDYAFGYDAQKEEYGDLYKLGIIDPTKVVRTALQDAASIAGLLITTERWSPRSRKRKPRPPPCRAAAWTIEVLSPIEAERAASSGALFVCVRVMRPETGR